VFYQFQRYHWGLGLEKSEMLTAKGQESKPGKATYIDQAHKLFTAGRL